MPFPRPRLSWFLVIAALLFVVYTAVFNPAENSYAPKCIVKSLTGYDCPGCGSQRALHALLHGRLWEAASYNLFLLFGIPYLVALFLSDFVLKGKAQAQWQRITHSPWLLGFYLVGVMAWWVVRNLY